MGTDEDLIRWITRALKGELSWFEMNNYLHEKYRMTKRINKTLTMEEFQENVRQTVENVRKQLK